MAIPKLALVFTGVVGAGVLGVFGLVANGMYEANRAAGMSESEAVERLANQIVDTSVSAKALEDQGYYKVRYGGFYVDDCRKKVLTDTFNNGLPNKDLAYKITNCVYQRMVEASNTVNVRQ